jgi:predicted dehydrogenase
MSAPLSRRGFLGATGSLALGAAAASALPLDAALGAPAPVNPAGRARRRLAVVGTGHRATGAWGVELLKEQRERVEFVGLCDVNPLRAEASRRMIGVDAPTFTDFDAMLRATRPDTVLVTTVDATHDRFIVRALEAGVDVITEKPMTTDEAKAGRILDAERRTGRRVDVTFNYRYAPTHARIKELLAAGTIGPVTSVDFHWYLDTRHGSDYFRRWHAYRKNSGTLWVHKATHHFDLINWWLEADPVAVSATHALRRYGKNNPFRGRNCRTCPHRDRCEFFFDMTKDERLMRLYGGPERADGYLRDACVFREDIDTPDTMSATVEYSNGAMMSYSLNAFMPYEGYHLAFNGPRGRIEIRMYERQPWPVERGVDEIRVTQAFGGSRVIRSPWGEGGHFGGDPLLRAMLFEPGRPDPLKQRAGARAGAMSLLTGVAADRSARTGARVRVADLLEGRAARG